MKDTQAKKNPKKKQIQKFSTPQKKFQQILFLILHEQQKKTKLKRIYLVTTINYAKTKFNV